MTSCCEKRSKKEKLIHEARCRRLKIQTLHNTTTACHIHSPPPTTISNNSNITSSRKGTLDGKDQVLLALSRKQEHPNITWYTEAYDLWYDDFWYTCDTGNQDKWLSDSLPACNTSLNLSLLFSVCDYAQISTLCRLTVSSEVSLSQQRSSFCQIQCFFEGS